MYGQKKNRPEGAASERKALNEQHVTDIYIISCMLSDCKGEFGVFVDFFPEGR